VTARAKGAEAPLRCSVVGRKTYMERHPALVQATKELSAQRPRLSLRKISAALMGWGFAMANGAVPGDERAKRSPAAIVRPPPVSPPMGAEDAPATFLRAALRDAMVTVLTTHIRRRRWTHRDECSSSSN
jgi:hypothetical protein